MRGKMVKRLGCLAMAALLFAGGAVETSAASSKNFDFNNYTIHCGSAKGSGTVLEVVTQAAGGGVTCMAAIHSYQTMRKESGSVSALQSGPGWEEKTASVTAHKYASNDYIFIYVKGKHKAKINGSTSSVHYTADGSKR